MDELRRQCLEVKAGWVFSADITELFDNIDCKLFMSILRRRVKDSGLLRLIGKWLRAGVMEGIKTTYPDRGTPQGGMMTPRTQKATLHFYG